MSQQAPPSQPPPAPSTTRRTVNTAGKAVAGGAKAIGRRFDSMLSARGPQYRALAESQLASVAGDTLVTLALAGTLFFDVPSTEARSNVALYLVITLAPFAVLGPLLRGEPAKHEGEEYRVALSVEVADPQPVPLVLAALGPRMLELAGREADGTILWMGGEARYIYVLEADAANPGVPPNLDEPEGTLWFIDVSSDDRALGCGMRYGEVPDRGRQRVPADGAPPTLEPGETYYRYVLRDIALPITRCLFTYQPEG